MGEKFSRDFGLCDQVRRAAVSIMSNIAEGFERDGDKEFAQFLSIAKSSAGELRWQMFVALDQDYISQSEFESVKEKAMASSRMISGLIRYLKQSDLKGKKYR
jgi:four helix bundle protein